jgi:hypothetical protein
MRRSLRVLSRLGIAVALSALAGGPARASLSFYSGSVTLPFEVRWGGAVIPAGEYSLSMDSARGALRVIDGSGRTRALLFSSLDDARGTQPTALLITSDGTQRTVRSFNCPEWGFNFVYRPLTRAERNLIALGEPVEAIGVRMASR